ncbi:hypothetical protein NKI46_01070 [Mesorhizobium sp. M0615]|uniref:hypothetical protein n=1 Tax=Mesorhizobium sp. M0615 TaxID=2956971 RepID=UPI00333D1A91
MAFNREVWTAPPPPAYEKADRGSRQAARHPDERDKRLENRANDFWSSLVRVFKPHGHDALRTDSRQAQAKLPPGDNPLMRVNSIA